MYTSATVALAAHVNRLIGSHESDAHTGTAPAYLLDNDQLLRDMLSAELGEDASAVLHHLDVARREAREYHLDEECLVCFPNLASIS